MKQSLNISNMLLWSDAWMQVAFINKQQNHQIMPSLKSLMMQLWISVFMI